MNSLSPSQPIGQNSNLLSKTHGDDLREKTLKRKRSGGSEDLKGKLVEVQSFQKTTIQHIYHSRLKHISKVQSVTYDEKTNLVEVKHFHPIACKTMRGLTLEEIKSRKEKTQACLERQVKECKALGMDESLIKEIEKHDLNQNAILDLRAKYKRNFEKKKAGIAKRIKIKHAEIGAESQLLPRGDSLKNQFLHKYNFIRHHVRPSITYSNPGMVVEHSHSIYHTTMRGLAASEISSFISSVMDCQSQLQEFGKQLNLNDSDMEEMQEPHREMLEILLRRKKNRERIDCGKALVELSSINEKKKTDSETESLDEVEVTELMAESHDLEETEESETESPSIKPSMAFDHTPLSGGTFNPQSHLIYDPHNERAEVFHGHQFYSQWAPIINPHMRESCASRIRDCMDWQRDMGQKLGFSEQAIEEMQSKDQAELFALQED